MFSRSLFQKEGYEIWGCSFVSESKVRSTSSAEKIFADEITWITWKTEKNLEVWPFLNSHLEMWVCESGRKIDPATGVSPNNYSSRKNWRLSNQIIYEMKTANAPRCWVPVLRDHTIGPKIMENGNYSTAPWMNMRRSAHGNLVQWVNL